MLHIILGILKVIGIILAAVILLLLGIALAVLFVPVRYKGSITKTSDQMAAQIRVTWLLRMISVVFAYDHGQKKKVLEIRIFGVSFESIRKFIKKLAGRKERRRRKKELRMKEKEQRAQEKELQMLEKEQYSLENVSESETASESESKPETEFDSENEIKPEIELDSEDELKSEIELDSENETKTDTDFESELIDGSDIAPEQELDYGLEQDFEQKTESAEDPGSKSESSKPHKKFSLSEKLQSLKCKLLSVWDTVKNTVQKIIQTIKKIWNSIRSVGLMIFQIPEKISQLLTKLAQIPEKISDFQKLLEKYEVKEVLQDVWKEVMHLLRCYGPRRITGYLKFGTVDPAKTGQLLGIMYILLPARADKFSLEPDFTEAVFETDMHIKGHIRVNHAVAVAWRLFRNKKLMRAIKGLRKERSK